MSYTIVDNEIIRADLKATPKIVLIAILSYHNKEKGYSYPSHSDLMRDCCIKDKNTLIKAIKELENLGCLRKETIKGVGNRYYIEGVGENKTTEKISSVKNPTTPVGKTQLEVYEKPNTTNTKINTKTNINNKKKQIYKDLSFIDLSLVKVTEEEYIKLIELAKGDTELIHDKMLSLEVGIANKKKKYLGYKNHYLTLRQWINKDNKKTPTAIGAENKNIKVNSSICNTGRKYTQACDIG